MCITEQLSSPFNPVPKWLIKCPMGALFFIHFHLWHAWFFKFIPISSSNSHWLRKFCHDWPFSAFPTVMRPWGPQEKERESMSMKEWASHTLSPGDTHPISGTWWTICDPESERKCPIFKYSELCPRWFCRARYTVGSFIANFTEYAMTALKNIIWILLFFEKARHSKRIFRSYKNRLKCF